MNEKINIKEIMLLYCGLNIAILNFLSVEYDKTPFRDKLRKAFSYCLESKLKEHSKEFLQEICKWYLYDIIVYSTINNIVVNRLYSESVNLINKYLNRGE